MYISRNKLLKMKKSVLNFLRSTAALACLAFLTSCGGDNCQTCTMEGQEDEEICDPGGIGSGLAFDAAIAAQEALGYDCN